MGVGLGALGWVAPWAFGTFVVERSYPMRAVILRRWRLAVALILTGVGVAACGGESDVVAPRIHSAREVRTGIDTAMVQSASDTTARSSPFAGSGN